MTAVPPPETPGAGPTTRVVTLDAPAKVNLGLRVLGRRPDGYHLLESVFAPLDLCDTVEVAWTTAPTREVRLAVAAEAGLEALVRDVPTDERNLAARAARAFLEAGGLTGRVDIALTKRTPAAAGLGGGSSDAGAVLRALSDLAPGAVGAAERARLALSLGADVPFFLDPRPALVTGIGERTEPIEGLPRLDLVLANPGVSLDTAAVYAAWDALAGALTPPSPGSTMRALSDFLACHPSDGASRSSRLATLLRNDLEAAAVRLCPPVGRLRRSLEEAGASATAMSGSGATVFGVFADSAAAEAGYERIASGGHAWVHLAVTGGAG